MGTKHITEQHKVEFLKLSQENWSARRIAKKFEVKLHVVLHWALVSKVKFTKPVKYCPICGQQVEDNTKCGTKIYCSVGCVEKMDKERRKKYGQKYYKKRGYAGLLKENRAEEGFPSYRCEFGHLTVLTYDPRRWQNRELFRGIECHKCIEQKTA